MKNYQLFFLLCFILFFISEFAKYLLGITELTYNSLSEQLSYDQLEEVFSRTRKWQFVGYVLIPVMMLLKISIIAGLLDLGLFFLDKKIRFKRLFNIVVKAEFIFVLVALIKIGWFYFIKTDFDLQEIQHFYPLSILNVVNNFDLHPWFIYPLQVFNLFELMYWIMLAYLIGKELNIRLLKGLSIVASGYGVGLLIWVVGIMFFTLNMS